MSAALERPLAPPASRPFRILLVETDPALVAAVRWVLEDDGHQVLVHFAGQGVPERVRDERADLVMIDPRLPWLSRDELERTLELRDGVRPVPVIFFSDGGEFELRALARRHRAFGHVSKSEIPRLRRRIRAFLDLD